MFTGKFATSHGARYDPAGPLRLTSGIEGPESWDAYRARRLGNEHRTLAETLRNEGFATSAVVAGPWMKKVFGLSRGFESYDDDGLGTVAGRSAQDVTDAALGWIEGSQSASDGGEKPFFLFLNYYDPHSPYVAPPGFAERYLTPEMRQRKQATPEVVNALYDAEIHYMDHHIGRLFSSLREHGLYDSTWILVTADHGELLGEHGEMGHGNLLTQEELHIPFILKPPAGLEPPRRDDSTIQTTDVMPVILDRLGLDVPPGVQGAAAAEARPPVVSEVYPLPAWSPHGDWRTLIEGDSKFSWNSRGNHRLYRLDEDPAESNNLIAVMPARARAMQRKLQEFIESLPLPAPASEEEVELDPETREALESLGYVH